jgi:3-oxoacyl-[acyl-carrier protein] reductase
VSEDDWDAVLAAHLKGHFCVTRHATAYWRDRARAAGGPVSARLINTAAEAGLRGSPAQPYFAGATAGVLGLTRSVARACGAPAAADVNGRVFVSFGGSVHLVAEPDVDHRFDNPGDGPWDAGALARALAGHFGAARRA